MLQLVILQQCSIMRLKKIVMTKIIFKLQLPTLKIKKAKIKVDDQKSEKYINHTYYNQ